MSAPGLSIIKLGGSLAADRGRLRGLLAALADGAHGPCIVVPGGGSFADAVRIGQDTLGFDDRLAHRLALDAMGRMAEVFCAIEPRLFRIEGPPMDSAIGAAVAAYPLAPLAGRGPRRPRRRRGEAAAEGEGARTDEPPPSAPPHRRFGFACASRMHDGVHAGLSPQAGRGEPRLVRSPREICESTSLCGGGQLSRKRRPVEKSALSGSVAPLSRPASRATLPRRGGRESVGPVSPLGIRTPVWDPARLRDGHPDIPETWDVTSDSLALWLAAETRAARCVLVKSIDAPSSRSPADLARMGLVDAAFPDFAARYAGEIFVRGPGGIVPVRSRAAA